MDGVLVLLIALALYFKHLPKKAQEQGQEEDVVCVTLNPTLNPDMFHDENAFMEVANELGFR